MKAIVVIPTQGFGNRLRMIASSYILSQFMKLDHFVLWQPSHDCNIDFEDIWSSSPFKTIDLDSISKSHYAYFGVVHTNKVMKDILNSGDVKYIVLTGGHEFKHPAMNTDEYLHNKYKLYSQLQFKCDDSLVLPPLYGCIHIRNITEKDAKDVEKYQNCNFSQNSPIKEFLALIKKVDNAIPLYVISNDLLISKTLQTHFPNKQILVSNPSSTARDCSNGMQSAIRDFSILSKSIFIIGTFYSSFSDEASFFNMIPKIIPLSQHLQTQFSYHCSGYTIVDKIGYINYDKNTVIKFFI